jgi:hypothetical protein
MNKMAILAGALALTACGGATSQAGNEANGSTGNQVATSNSTRAGSGQKPAAAPAADNAANPSTQGGSTLDRSYLVGRWTDDGDCTAVTEFRADGSFLYPWGDTGQWTLSGDRLTLAGSPSPFTIRVIDPNTLERTAAGGTPHRVTRCT